jgi:hypothetical protein
LKNPKFDLFSAGLEAAMERVEEYYNKTATSHAYTFVMREYFFLDLRFSMANSINSTRPRYEDEPFREALEQTSAR